MIYVVEYLAQGQMRNEYFKNKKEAMKFVNNEISEMNFLALYKSDIDLSANAEDKHE